MKRTIKKGKRMGLFKKEEEFKEIDFLDNQFYTDFEFVKNLDKRAFDKYVESLSLMRESWEKFSKVCTKDGREFQDIERIEKELLEVKNGRD